MVASCSRVVLLILILALLFNPAFAFDLQTPTAIIPASYFGLHIHHLGTQTTWPNMPVPEWRLWDAFVTWQDIEPSKNVWHFDRLDGYVSIAEQHETGILLPLAMTPTWASARPQEASSYKPGNAAEPANPDDWRAFVRTVVGRYKGRIQAYEIWNEPNLKGFWTGNADQMVTLTKEASQIIHSVDPQAIVVSPSVTGSYGTKWFADFVQKGVGQYVDVIGYHCYVTPKMPEEMVPLVQTIRQILADNGIANKPVWDTESGWLDPTRFDSDDVAAGYLARAYILLWAAGAQRFYWFAWDNHKVAIRTLQEDNQTPTPAGRAYVTMQQWLIGAQMADCVKSPADGTWASHLKRPGQNQWIVWNPQGNRKFNVPPDWKIATITPLLQPTQPLNGLHIDIGPAPVLLTGPS